jgi:hypothetical protein
VSLSSPAGGSTFATPANITLTADASDSDGTIGKVDFYAGSTLIGTAATPVSGNAYSIPWNNVAPGAYILTAKATDNTNTTATSSGVNINVVWQTGLSPTADAYVKDGSSASANFGAAADLQTQASSTSGKNRETYLKFDLAAVSCITRARIRLHGRLSDHSGSNVGAAIYPVSNMSWTETGLIWNTRPEGGTTALSAVTITDGQNRWYEWDVTSYIQSEKSAGRNVVSFVIKNPATSSPYSTFSSREAAGNRPQFRLLTASSRNVFFVVGSTNLSIVDSAIKTRLETLGFTVTVKAAGNSPKSSIKTSDADGKSLVVISASVTPNNVGDKFRHIPIPVLVWKDALLDDMGMTGGACADYGVEANQTQLAIINPAHPMAANLSGTVAVTATAGELTWGKPNANAIKIATLVADPTRVVIFGYDAGVAMPGLEAPLRRVGVYISATVGNNLTPDGGALFDAAVKWATEVDIL